MLTGRDADASGGVSIVVQVTLERQTEECMARFEAAVRKHPEIQECFLMTGAVDYWLRLDVESPAAYESIHGEVLSRLPGVKRIHSGFALRDALKQRRAPRRDLK